ncbi:MAG: GntR family transcriptional regulator [Deltaproteobacteria bacterium]|nr:GntR family transcriptional regulator [Deltaproteobacteria bacterium]
MENTLKISIQNPVSIREKVYRVIRDEILNGNIAPGARLIETRLAKQIKTSRTPVREALHLLEREGLLVAIPRVGYRVKQLSWDEVEEICEIRAVNETLAARWAIKRITSKNIRALEKNIEEAEREVKEGNPKAFVERDAEFHEILVRASGSERLMELCEQLRRHMLRYRIESLYLAETALAAIEGHKGILECLKKRDEKRIGTAVRRHLEFAKRSIQEHAFVENRGRVGVPPGKNGR